MANKRDGKLERYDVNMIRYFTSEKKCKIQLKRV